MERFFHPLPVSGFPLLDGSLVALQRASLGLLGTPVQSVHSSGRNGALHNPNRTACRRRRRLIRILRNSSPGNGRPGVSRLTAFLTSLSSRVLVAVITNPTHPIYVSHVVKPYLSMIMIPALWTKWSIFLVTFYRPIQGFLKYHFFTLINLVLKEFDSLILLGNHVRYLCYLEFSSSNCSCEFRQPKLHFVLWQRKLRIFEKYGNFCGSRQTGQSIC